MGASRDRRKFGNRAVRAFRRQGHDVIPINPNVSEVEGLRTYASVLDVPRAIDVATLYVPPHIGVSIISDIAAKGIPELWVNPGAESDTLVAVAHALGLKPILACSILAIGEDPDLY